MVKSKIDKVLLFWVYRCSSFPSNSYVILFIYHTIAATGRLTGHHQVVSAAGGARNCGHVDSRRNHNSTWSAVDEGEWVMPRSCQFKPLYDILCIHDSLDNYKWFEPRSHVIST